jgi:branched-chain amino acid transport system substrate-binding protein
MTRKQRSTSIVARICIVLATTALIAAACGDGDDDEGNVDGASSQIVIGALLDLSGSWQTLGRASQATLELAAADINERLEAAGRDERVSLQIEDTGLQPATALQKIEALHAQGVRIVIGPQSSSELREVKDFADENGMIVISQGSTASSLSIADDNVFRMTPDDRREAEALIPLMLDDEPPVATILPVCRQDAGNQGLCASVSELFEEAGGEVLPQIDYEAGADATTLYEEVKGAIGQTTGEGAAIYLAAFDEAVDLFTLAQAEGVLSGVRWYGSDGMALNARLVAPESSFAAEFAAAADYPNPIFGLDPALQAAWQAVFAAVQTQVGFDPDAFALSTYDALNIVVDAFLDAGGVDDTDAFKEAFISHAASNESITGSTEFNDAGDRAFAFFDFWAVRPQSGGSYGWQKVATYRPGADGAPGVIERHE